MSDIAIKVENLSKRFQIGTASRPAYHRLSEAITGAPQFLWNACRGLIPGRSTASPDSETLASDPSEFWALKDVSFEVKQGEVVGIIGRNGAGKSTLLKILSRITEPTSGRFGVKGRVASLLEVGTGFHPELTGRENIYVSGVTLGMTRAEVKKRFDEIVDFSGVEKFLDTPVKHYSSGMQVRLGFAVAAHLESEILIVDEVLAVGDAEFQKKCFSQMANVAASGRTILFVSHNMAAIRNICHSALLLGSGVVEFAGRCEDVLKNYRQPRIANSDFASAIAALPVDAAINIESIGIFQNGESLSRCGNGEPIEVVIAFEILIATSGLRIYLDLLDENETLLVRSFHDDDSDFPSSFTAGHFVSSLRIPADFLAPRNYQAVLRAGIHNERACFGGEGITISLEIDRTGLVNRSYPGDPIRSSLQPRWNWSTSEAKSR